MEFGATLVAVTSRMLAILAGEHSAYGWPYVLQSSDEEYSDDSYQSPIVLGRGSGCARNRKVYEMRVSKRPELERS